jgi:putative FmdB family regulatory protein
MPIYEFYCSDCATLFTFYSSRVETEKRPSCPSCQKSALDRWLSTFTRLKADGAAVALPSMPPDESKMEQAFVELARASEAGTDDGRHLVGLLRDFAQTSGLALDGGADEALVRLEGGASSAEIAAEYEDMLRGDEGATYEAMKQHKATQATLPKRDEKLYFL